MWMPSPTKPNQVESSPLQLLVCTVRGFVVGLRVGIYERTPYLYKCICTCQIQVHNTTSYDTDTCTSPAHAHSPNRFKARHLGSAGEVAVAVTSVPSCRIPWSISAGKIGTFFSVKSRRQYYPLSECGQLPSLSSYLADTDTVPWTIEWGRTIIIFSIEVNYSCTYSVASKAHRRIALYADNWILKS